MSEPLEGTHEDAVIECLGLASVPQLGRELARRVERFKHIAKLAEDRSARATTLLEVAHAAETAHAAAQRAGDLALAVLGCLGPCEEQRSAYTDAAVAKVSADTAAKRYRVVARVVGKGAHV